VVIHENVLKVSKTITGQIISHLCVGLLTNRLSLGIL
jgi:hypothetical protein